MKIGILDSGKGGLAVAKRIKNKNNQLIIIMDQGFFPYGTKSKEFLLKRSYYLARYLIEYGAELIVLACNTLSVLACPFLKQNLSVPVLGIFDYFIPYLTKENTLIASKATINYAQRQYPVQVWDGTDFIEAIEKKQDIQPFLEQLKMKKPKCLLLGCTHFLTIPDKDFPVPTINQISMLLEDIKKARKNSSL